MGDFDEARPSGNGHIRTAANGTTGVFSGARKNNAHDVMYTSCGREITVGRLKLSGAAHPVARVTMNFGCEPHDHGQVWMSLTASECRHLAGMLLAQAASADRECVTGDNTAAPGGSQPAQLARRTLPPGRIEIAFVTGDAYTVHARGHHMLTDQPIKDGGLDMAATPTELFVTSLASCVAFYAGRYLSRHGFSREGLQVSAEFDMAAAPARVGAIRLRIRIPIELPPRRAQALLAVVSHCTVGNTLSMPPAIDIALV